MKYYIEADGIPVFQIKPENPHGTDPILKALRIAKRMNGRARLVPESAADLKRIQRKNCRSLRKLVWHFHELKDSKAALKAIHTWSNTTVKSIGR